MFNLPGIGSNNHFVMCVENKLHQQFVMRGCKGHDTAEAKKRGMEGRQKLGHAKNNREGGDTDASSKTIGGTLNARQGACESERVDGIDGQM